VTLSPRRLTPRSAAATGLLVAAAWPVVEIAFRAGGRLTIGYAVDRPVVGDEIASAVGFPVLALGAAWWSLRRGMDPSDWGYRFERRALVIGVPAGLLALAAAGGAGMLDRALFSPLDTPSESDLHTSWVAALLLLVNGVVGPAFEELGWRGIIQGSLRQAWGPRSAIVATSILFSLKHMLVDWSADRLFTIAALGLVLGSLRERRGTASSTCAHIVANLTASTIAVTAT
jgi:CAAX protease family protein